jgi:Type II CAAX prenyl endopeptidase Rce1-like
MLDPEPGPDFAEPASLELKPVVRPFPWVYAAVLVAASIAGSLLLVPFSAALMKQMKNQPQIVLDLMPVIMVIEVGIEAVFSIAMVALGLGMGRSLGLVWPPLEGWDNSTGRAKRMRSALLLATASGIILAALFVGQAQLMEGAAKGKIDIKLPPWWSCLMASVGAGIREEVWLRLGLMTFFAWVFTKISRRSTPGAGAIWTANVLASLAFGAMHLPQAFQLIGGSLAVFAFVMIGNGIPGVVFGWLFWRKGLIAAMVSHTAFDVVTKVIIPLVTGG